MVLCARTTGDVIAGFAAVLLSLWFIDYLWNRQAKIPMMAWLGALGLNVVCISLFYIRAIYGYTLHEWTSLVS